MKSIKLWASKTLPLGIALLATSTSFGAKTENSAKPAHKESHQAGLGAHVHGNAKLSIALETETEGTLLLESPGDGIVGFEHAATTPADKKTQAAALALLENNASELFVFTAKAGCQLTKTRVEILKEEHHDGDADEDEHDGREHGEHNEIEAEYALKCRQSLTGTQLTIQLSTKFPRIKKLDVQVLGPKRQFSTTLKNGRGNVQL